MRFACVIFLLHGQLHACPAGYMFCVIFLKINFWAKSTQDLLDRFSPNFHHIVGMWWKIADLTPFPDGSRDVAMATNFRVKICEIGLVPFIRSPDILKRITLSPFWFLKVHLRWSRYTVCKFNELWSRNSGVYEGKICTPRRFFV